MKKKKIFLIIFIILCILIFVANIIRNISIINNLKKLSKEFLEDPENSILSVTALEEYDESEDYVDDDIDYDEDIPYYEVSQEEEMDSNNTENNVVENTIENSQVDSSDDTDIAEEPSDIELEDALDNIDESNEEEMLEEDYKEIDINELKLPDDISIFNIALQVITSDDNYYKIKVDNTYLYVNKNTGLIEKEEFGKNNVVTYMIEE